MRREGPRVVDPAGDLRVLGARLEAAYREGAKSNNCHASSRVIRGIPDKPRYGAPQTSTTGESTSVGWNSPSGSHYCVVRLLLPNGRRHMKFIVVNGRTPRPQQCYVDHSDAPVMALQNHARAS